MKKYLLSLAAFSSCLVIFFYSFATTSYAQVAEGGACSIAGNAPAASKCATGFSCSPNPGVPKCTPITVGAGRGIPGKTVCQENQTLTAFVCTKLASTTAPGKKAVGEACTADGDCTTGSHCDTAGKVCVPDKCVQGSTDPNQLCPGKFTCENPVLDPTLCSKTGKGACTIYAGTCAPAKTITCSCDSEGQTGSGQNGISCTVSTAFVGGAPTTVRGYCETSDQACTTGGSTLVANLTGDITSDPNFFGKTAAAPNVTCGAQPTIPPPPSPPCITWNNGKCDSMQSAFGALSTAPESFVKTIFSILLSLSGGIALLLIMRAGYQMMVSQGKPEQLNAARDQLVAAIVGLVFLIFSFVLLQAIGFDLLKIPGFSGA